jgi:hypothetical protein
MKNTIKFIGIIALAAVIGFSMASCGDNGGGFNDVRITITGIPSTHFNLADENENFHKAIMEVGDARGDAVISAGGTVTIALEYYGEAWNGRGPYLISITFSYYPGGGDFVFTRGQDFQNIPGFPDPFNPANHDLEEYLPRFNITSGRHTIPFSQFRNSGPLFQ